MLTVRIAAVEGEDHHNQGRGHSLAEVRRSQVAAGECRNLLVHVAASPIRPGLGKP